ncbi:hypothetical protein D3C86_907200 [compost metagenome]
MFAIDALVGVGGDLTREAHEHVMGEVRDLVTLNPAAQGFRPEFPGGIDVDIGHVVAGEDFGEGHQIAVQIDLAVRKWASHRFTSPDGNSRSRATSAVTRTPASTRRVGWGRDGVAEAAAP